MSKSGSALKEAPKSEAVAEEQAERQMPMFDGFQVERIEARISGGEVKLIPDQPCPKQYDVRYFLVKGKAAINHMDKKGGGKFEEKRLTRIANFETLSADEITPAQANRIIE